MAIEHSNHFLLLGRILEESLIGLPDVELLKDELIETEAGGEAVAAHFPQRHLLVL
jgi:hypothetical protein